MNPDGTISWRQLLVETTSRLGDPLESRWVCQEVAGVEGIEWLDLLDLPVGERAVARLDAMVARRLTGEPLAHVLGRWSFRTLELMVDRRVLIPRPETELVAERAIAEARSLAADPARRPVTVADLGTGSGAIALSVAAELPVGHVEVWATDISPDALDVARANLTCLPFRAATGVRLAAGPWFEALPRELEGTLSVVVSNPPYIAVVDEEIDDSVRRWEPPMALFGGDDGLEAYREIVTAAPRWLSPGGLLVLEIGHRQAGPVADLLAAAGFSQVTVHADLTGRDRIVTARRPRSVDPKPQ